MTWRTHAAETASHAASLCETDIPDPDLLDVLNEIDGIIRDLSDLKRAAFGRVLKLSRDGKADWRIREEQNV